MDLARSVRGGGAHHSLVMVHAVTVDQLHSHQELQTAVFCKMCEILPLGGFRGIIASNSMAFRVISD
jgi:hypothetical protein